MIIYMRTEEGQEAAYSLTSALPRKLKSILKVIDDKTRNEVFRKNLHSFGDVDGLLRSLEMAGLLKLAPDSPHNAAANLNPNSGAEHQSQYQDAPQALREHDWSATRNPLDHGPQRSFAQADSQAYLSMTHSINRPTTQEFDSPKSQALASALTEMGNFVLTHMPDQSFQILKEIEEITSLEVLAATLGGYEQMVSVMGQQGLDHLRSIKSILRQYL